MLTEPNFHASDFAVLTRGYGCGRFTGICAVDRDFRVYNLWFRDWLPRRFGGHLNRDWVQDVFSSIVWLCILWAFVFLLLSQVNW